MRYGGFPNRPHRLPGAAMSGVEKNGGAIELRLRKMFWAPTRRRHYSTLSLACRAEAGAIISREWRENGEEGRWGDNPDMIIRRDVLAREIEDAFRLAVRGDAP